MRRQFLCGLSAAILACLPGFAAAGTAWDAESKTVLGPSNAALADGAAALMAGDAEEGVRLTLRGLSMPTSVRERVAGWANLCAGYLMLERLDDALAYCDRAIDADPEHWRALSNRALVYLFKEDFVRAEDDLGRAESIAPKARSPRQVRAMLLNAVSPVEPRVTVDDRRRAPVSRDDD